MANTAKRFEEGLVRGFLHEPDSEAWSTLILTHGAGSDCNAPLLMVVAMSFSVAGVRVLRCDLPFRQQRPKGPPFPGGAHHDREGLRDAVKTVYERWSGKIFLGGHSYGGRQATILASEDVGPVTSLLLFSYPLHPPAKPEQLRTAHFPGIKKPAFFVHGSKDEFGTIEEMRQALELMPEKKKLREIEGAGHDLKRGRFDMAGIVKEFCEWGANEHE
jgi:predicted alpha/beta-hydrolase family hydrolase